MADDNSAVVDTQSQPFIHIGEPQYQIDRWVNEVAGRRGKAFEALRDEFQALVTGLCDQFAMVTKHNPGFDLSQVTFERPRWMNGGQPGDVGGKFVFEISYKGSAMLPHNARWD